MRFHEADRGTSILVNYVLALAIVTVLATGLLILGNDLVEDERERSVHASFEVVGNRLVADLATVDRLASGEGSETVELRATLPDQVAASEYLVHIEDHPDRTGNWYLLKLESSAPDVSTVIEFRTEQEVTTGSFDSDDLLIRFDASEPKVVVSSA